MHGMDRVGIEVNSAWYLRACDPFFNTQSLLSWRSPPFSQHIPHLCPVPRTHVLRWVYTHRVPIPVLRSFLGYGSAVLLEHSMPIAPFCAVQQVTRASPCLSTLEVHMFKAGLHCRNLKHAFNFPLSGKPRFWGVFPLTVC